MRALKKWRKRANRTPEDPNAWFELGLAAIEAGEAGEAYDALRRSAEIIERDFSTDPSAVPHYIAIGRAFEHIGHIEQAVTAYQSAYELEPNSTETAGYLGLALAKMGSVDEGIQKLRQACALSPTVPEASYVLATWLMEVKQYEEAIEYFQRVVQLAPQNYDARLKLGQCLRVSGRYFDALKELRVAHDGDPMNAHTRIELALAVGAVGERERAVAMLREVATMAPATNVGPLIAVGAAFRELGELSMAISYLREATRLDPSSSEAHTKLGDALLHCGLIEPAITALGQAVRLDPESGYAHYGLGLALERQQDYRGAVAALSRATMLMPGNTEAGAALDRLVVAESGEKEVSQPSVTGPVFPFVKRSTAFSGELGTFSMADLLDFLKVNRRTGTLMVAQNDGMGEVRLEEGRITAAAAPKAGHLRDLLIHAKTLSDQQIVAIVGGRQQVSDDQLVGALLSAGAVDEKTLRSCVSKQVHTAITELVSWTEGTFAFEPQQSAGESDQQGPSPIQFDVDGVLLEVMRLMDEQNR